ncbi:MAG: hypothetical protein AAFU03_17235, partial [Bacteroidota bacterium]
YSEPVFTKVYDRDRPNQPTGLKASTDTTGLIAIEWDAPEERDVVGYYVYASDGNRRAFRRLTNGVFPLRRYADTVATQMLNQYRYYYVVAVDKDFLYSPPSDTIKVVRPDINPPAPALIDDYNILSEGIRLTFRPSNSRDIASHQLLRRQKDTDWEIIGSWEKPVFSHIDSTVQAGSTYLYAFQAIDRSGLRSKIVSELQLKAQPRVLVAPSLELTSLDFRIFLKWEGGADASAYQLYRSVNDGPLQRLATLPKDTIEFADARTKSGKKYRYQLRLINSEGRQSPLSEPVEIQL